MPSSEIQLLLSLGVGGAIGALIIIRLFAFLAQKQKDDRELWGNHLTSLSSGVAQTNLELARLVTGMTEAQHQNMFDQAELLREFKSHDNWERDHALLLRTPPKKNKKGK